MSSCSLTRLPREVWWVRLFHTQTRRAARLVEGKVCLIQTPAGRGGGWRTPVQRPTDRSTTQTFSGNQWGQSFSRQKCEGAALCRNSPGSCLRVTFRSVISGLTNIILIVFRTVNLQVQGRFDWLMRGQTGNPGEASLGLWVQQEGSQTSDRFPWFAPQGGWGGGCQGMRGNVVP